MFLMQFIQILYTRIKYLLFNNIKKKSTHLFTNFIRLYEKLYHRYEKTDQVLLFENGLCYILSCAKTESNYKSCLSHYI